MSNESSKPKKGKREIKIAYEKVTSKSKQKAALGLIFQILDDERANLKTKIKKI